MNDPYRLTVIEEKRSCFTCNNLYPKRGPRRLIGCSLYGYTHAILESSSKEFNKEENCDGWVSDKMEHRPKTFWGHIKHFFTCDAGCFDDRSMM